VWRGAAQGVCREGQAFAGPTRAPSNPLSIHHPPSHTRPHQHPLHKRQADLLQFPDRDEWYVAKFAADDAPDWNPAELVANEPLIPGVRVLTLAVEASRERVPLRNAYTRPGQRAAVRLSGGPVLTLRLASPPPPPGVNAVALQMTKGDIFANETKSVREPESVRVEWDLWVPEDGDTADLAKAVPGESLLEVGPCVGTGLDLKGPIAAVFARPTLVLFVWGAGAATARALIEAAEGAGGLAPLGMRRDVVVYYRAPTARAVAWGEAVFEGWSAATKGKVRVVTSTRETFGEMFDFDDELEYDPAETAAIILTGGGEAGGGEEAGVEEAAARAACAEAEIGEVVSDSVDAPPVVHVDTRKVL
jgi:hypothetical protein